MDPFQNAKRNSISFGRYSTQLGGPVSNRYLNATASSPNPTGSNSAYTSRSPMYSPLAYSQQLMPSTYSPQYPSTLASNGLSTKVCEYDAHRPLFGLDWNTDDYVCLGSYKENSANKLQIIHSSDLLNWEDVVDTKITFPVSKIQWHPTLLGGQKFATCSDSLRIWSLENDPLQQQPTIKESINLSLCKYNGQCNHNTESKQVVTSQDASLRTLGQFPPITSFDWNRVNTSLLISSSIDTTCTVWDLQSSNYVKTQLIAHDSEVFDVKFLTQSTELFASCGGDGSVRVFDLRSLAHSTIIYESSLAAEPASSSSASPSAALLRLEPSPTDPNVIATFGMHCNKILVLDMRNPGTPVTTLEGHEGPLNHIVWHPSKRNVLLSCSDDCQAMYWDLNEMQGTAVLDSVLPESTVAHTPLAPAQSSSPRVLDTPSKFYSSGSQEINNIVMRPKGDWFGCVMGKTFKNIKI